MAVEIIHKGIPRSGKPKYEVACGKCLSVMHCLMSDFKSGGYDQRDGTEWYILKCPVCKVDIAVYSPLKEVLMRG